jgi:hypothetical protein
VPDSQDRRKADTPFRRALVHDFDDGLTINWDDDYPGGVTVRAVRRVIGKAGSVGVGQIFRTLILESNIVHFLSAIGVVTFKLKKLMFQSEDENPGVEIGGQIRFNDAVTFAGATKVAKTVQLPTGAPALMEYDLFEQISQLRGEVAALQAALANGQENWRWCNKCQGLFFAGGPNKGVCPAGGEHSHDGSGNYRLPTA